MMGIAILDIHTHHLPSLPGQAIVNINPVDFIPQQGQYYSVGFHPWYLSEDRKENWGLFSKIANNPQVLAIGEAGLDKTHIPYALQEEVFEKQIAIASSLQKPLIIHCVRSYNEIISLKKTRHSDLPWIIHGFRGKKELAKQLTDHGLYLSFGFNYPKEAIRATPPDMLFLETDDNRSDIHLLYQQAAAHLSLSVNTLTEKIQENINRIFFKVSKQSELLVQIKSSTFAQNKNFK